MAVYHRVHCCRWLWIAFIPPVVPPESLYVCETGSPAISFEVFISFIPPRPPSIHRQETIFHEWLIQKTQLGEETERGCHYCSPAAAAATVAELRMDCGRLEKRLCGFPASPFKLKRSYRRHNHHHRLSHAIDLPIRHKRKPKVMWQQ